MIHDVKAAVNLNDLPVVIRGVLSLPFKKELVDDPEDIQYINLCIQNRSLSDDHWFLSLFFILCHTMSRNFPTLFFFSNSPPPVDGVPLSDVPLVLGLVSLSDRKRGNSLDIHRVHILQRDWTGEINGYSFVCLPPVPSTVDPVPAPVSLPKRTDKDREQMTVYIRNRQKFIQRENR